MRRILLVLFAFVALTACATGRSRRVLQPNPRYYEAYYDGHYGPFIDGYWGRDERYFWYLGPDKVWRRDTQRHFLKADPGPHFSWVRGSGLPRAQR